MLADEAGLVVEVLETNYHFGEIVGFGIAADDQQYFIETEMALASDKFKDWLQDQSKKKTVFDAKRAEVALAWHEAELSGVDFDINLAAYLIDPSESNDNLAAVAGRYGLNFVYEDEAFYGKGAKQKIPEAEKLADHLGRKAASLLALSERLSEALEKNEQTDLFTTVEMPLEHILAEMEYQGVAVSEERLRKMGKELDQSLAALEKEIHELAGRSFNINSPKQLGEILFEELELPVIKKTKTGYSTSADVLEKLQSEHKIIDKILDYRQLGKLNSTYIEGLTKIIHPKTGKIHTRFNQTLTQTGRLSSTDPNLQNIPIRLEEGRKIRQAFVASQDGWKLLSADYSQIELRVLAHIAEDEGLIEAFNNEMDVHTKTAMDVFDVEADEVTSLMRRQAKAVNFGIVYGISDYGLSQSLNINRKEAQAFIDRYLESYPGVKAYMDDIVRQAKHDGYVTTLLHRRRYLPEISSRNFNRRSFAERTAMNTPIQGSAADIIKMAMIEMARALEEKDLKSKMLLQVHDELIFEVPEDELDDMKKLVASVMENALELKVPLKVDVSEGDSWYEAK